MTPALVAVLFERQQQRATYGDQTLPDGTGAPDSRTLARVAQNACERGPLTWSLILREEVAEAMAETDPDLLRGELVQVAAVALQWVEALDRRRHEERISEK